MNQNILHVGIDVDDTQYHGSAFNKSTDEVIDFRCRPTLKGPAHPTVKSGDSLLNRTKLNSGNFSSI